MKDLSTYIQNDLQDETGFRPISPEDNRVKPELEMFERRLETLHHTTGSPNLWASSCWDKVKLPQLNVGNFSTTYQAEPHLTPHSTTLPFSAFSAFEDSAY
mmetsp:Transcript_3189/g.3564  ORF Transcript_3189/g.3564 Transcript_3189/m.3564 type:complete len:101 (+) Transcript_3189:1-303(+)